MDLFDAMPGMGLETAFDKAIAQLEAGHGELLLAEKHFQELAPLVQRGLLKRGQVEQLEAALATAKELAETLRGSLVAEKAVMCMPVVYAPPSHFKK